MTAAIATVYAALLAAGVVTALKGKWGVLVVGLLVGPAWLLGAIRLARPDSFWARRFYGAEKRRRAAEEQPRRRRLAIASSVLAVALVAAALALLKAYRIPSSAMEPTLRCAQPQPGCSAAASDRVLAYRLVLGKTAGRGDIVTFELPPRGVERCGARGIFVKRVVALPGERVSGRDGRVFVDREALDEPYVKNRGDDSFRATVVPRDHYFVLGDNRSLSCDSRVWGPLPRENLEARLLARYWPPSRIGGVG